MNEHEQRIEIAKVCGWKFDTHKDSDGEYSFPVGASWYVIPDYTDDLNAMHEAEKMLYGNPNLPKKYTQQIKNAIRREAGVTKAQMDFDVCITATASQRAEAFLRTIGKWTETNSIKEPAYL